jgi:hypothetical protein
MVINDLDIVRAVLTPPEADPPSPVDADAEPACHEHMI